MSPALLFSRTSRRSPVCARRLVSRSVAGDLRLPGSLLLTGLILLGFMGCGGSPLASRGYILISIDTLRADHLGCYGYERDTSPFIDTLAAHGTLFENAYVQLPGTLPSHMSIFTGLYPSEHNVFPPDGVLSASIPTLPEILMANGFRTGGHTEGGYVHGDYGFARGFEEFSHEAWKIETDVTRTFARGLEFLQGIAPSERFFLFLHTYSVHDPYADARLKGAHFPEAYNSLYWQGPAPPGAVEPTGPLLGQLNQRGTPLDDDVKEYYRAAYDAQIRYLDDVLRDFFTNVEAMGLMEETTVVLTADHGEELADHGKLLHGQIYRETLNVPLIVLHPTLPQGRRLQPLVRSIDIAPTLFDLAGIEAPAPMSGVSFVPLLEGREPKGPSEALVESDNRAIRGLVRQAGDGSIHQLLWVQQENDEAGLWISGEMTFDTFGDELVARVESFRRPRGLEVLVDGERFENLGLELPREEGRTWVSRAASFNSQEEEVRVRLQSFGRPRRLEVLVGEDKLDKILLQSSTTAGLESVEETWVPSGEVPGEAWIGTDPVVLRFSLGPGEGARRVTLRTEGCNSSAELGLSPDPRCLSFQILESRGLGRAFEASSDLIVPTDPRTLRLTLPRPGQKKRITLRPDSCDVPAELGLSEDRRCLSLRVAVPELWRIELFDNRKDPRQASDLSSENSDLSLSMLRALQGYKLQPLAPAATRSLEPELEDRLRALGYLQ